MGSFLLENENNFKIESLDTEKKVADEYLTKEETEAKFKTKKKKPTKKSTKKKSIETSETDSNEIDSAQDSLKNLLNKKLNEENEIEGNDRKSRNAINQRDLIDIQQEQKRLNKYQRAIEKANEQSKVIYQKNENMDVETKNEDSAPIASRKKPEKKVDLEAQLLNAVKKRKETSTTSETQSGVVFNSTGEFVKGIASVEEILESTKKEKKNLKSVLEIDEEDQAEIQNMIQKQGELQRNHILKEKVDQNQKETEEKQKSEQKTKKQQSTKKKDVEIVSEDEDGQAEDIDIQPEKPANLGFVPTNFEEPLVETGLASTLSFLKSKGKNELKDSSFQVGRKNDNKYAFHGRDVELEKLDEEIDFRLEYKDADGRNLTPKEAFRLLSYKFHGMDPGKNKVAKRLRQIEEAKKKSTAQQSNSSFAMKALASQQKKI